MFLVSAILLLPFSLVFGWIFAVIIHELFHLVILKLLNITIFQITIKASGAVIRTDTMQPLEEMVCALAGPIGGCMGLLFINVYPYVAVFSFILSVYNLIPIYPADGGRVLRCILTIIYSDDVAKVVSDRTDKVIKLLILICAILWLLKLNCKPLIILCVASFLLIVLFKNSLQWKRKNSTM